MYSTGTCKMSEFYNLLKSKAYQAGWAVNANLDYKNIVPTMTDFTTPAPTVITQSGHWSFPAWHMFDGDDSTYWDYDDAGGWVTIDLGEGNGQKIDAFALTSEWYGYAPEYFKLDGSHDNSSWNQLFLEDGTPWGDHQRQVFQLQNECEEYRYYRLYVWNTRRSRLRIKTMELIQFSVGLSEGSMSSMTSRGTGNDNNFVLYLSKGDTTNDRCNFIEVGIAEDFVNGRFTNLYHKQYYFAKTTNGAHNLSDVTLKYYIDVDKERLFFATVLDDQALDPANNACYMGYMKTYSEEKDIDGNFTNHAQILALGMQSEYDNPTVLINKSGLYNQQIVNRVIPNSYSPSVWGDTVFLSPIFLEGQYEGMRGEMKEIFYTQANNVLNEDEVVVDSVKYKAILLTNYGNNAFPGACVLCRVV